MLPRRQRWPLAALATGALVAGGTLTGGAVVMAGRSTTEARAPDFGSSPRGIGTTTASLVPARAVHPPVTVAAAATAAPPDAPPDTAPPAPEPAAVAVAVQPVAAPPAEIVVANPTGASARVVPVGVSEGELLLPEDPSVVGWWAGSAAPGAGAGAVVLAGHIDSADRGTGAFAALITARVDDDVVVHDSLGGTHHYRVTARQSFSKTTLPREIFDVATPEHQLVLITCGGAFDRATGHYDDNIVVFATAADPPHPGGTP